MIFFDLSKLRAFLYRFLNLKITSVVPELTKFLFLFFCFFPYIRVYPFPLDLQPNAIFFSLIILLERLVEKIKFELLIFLIPLLFSFAILPLYSINLSTLRSLGNYLGFFSITAALFILLKNDLKMIKSWIRWASLIWGIVGLLQATIAPRIVINIISRGVYDGVGGRGVESLSPEPTNFGIVILFFMLMLFILKENNPIYYIILLVELFFISKSALAVGVLFLVLGIALILQIRSIKSTLVVTLVAVIFFYYFNPIELMDQHSRIVNLYHSLVRTNGISYLIKSDMSTNERLSNILFPLYGFIEKFPFPNGFSTFTNYFNEIKPLFSDIINTTANGNRIMSGSSSILFELGIFGILIIVVVSFIVFTANQLSIRDRLFVFFGLQLLFINNVQLSLPYFCLTIAVLSLLRKEKSIQVSIKS